MKTLFSCGNVIFRTSTCCRTWQVFTQNILHSSKTHQYILSRNRNCSIKGNTILFSYTTYLLISLFRYINVVITRSGMSSLIENAELTWIRLLASFESSCHFTLVMWIHFFFSCFGYGQVLDDNVSNGICWKDPILLSSYTNHCKHCGQMHCVT